MAKEKKEYDFSKGVRGPVKETTVILKKDEATQKLYKYVTDELRTLESFKEGFLAEIVKDPVKYLDNCDRAFEMMARYHVFKEVKEALTGKDSKATHDSLFRYAGDQIVIGAGRCNQSTSTTGSFFERCETAAWTYLYRQMIVVYSKV